MAVAFLGAGRPPGFKVGTVYLAAETGGQDSEPRRVCSGLERGDSFTLRLITDTKRGARVQGWSVLLKKQLNVHSFKILGFFFFWWQSFFGILSGKQGLWFYCWHYTGKRGFTWVDLLEHERPVPASDTWWGGFCRVVGCVSTPPTDPCRGPLPCFRN